MGDLISRSELIKLINNKYIGLNDAVDLYYGGIFDCFKEIKLMIKKQPTAYDIDKVIEELEKLADESYRAYCISFNSDDRAEYDAYTNAIEIVKKMATNQDFYRHFKPSIFKGFKA